ncbi:MAG: hypothetical protein K2X87_26270 [Gemmataceae bacterium]|nr:hypothetical protein [Gemmataceae bacterium]
MVGQAIVGAAGRAVRLAAVLGVVWVPADAGPAPAGPISGTLYFATFAGGANVNKVPYSYNGTDTFTLGGITNIASTFGADGASSPPTGSWRSAGRGTGSTG